MHGGRQVFIFVTISKFGALTCSIMGLARKVSETQDRPRTHAICLEATFHQHQSLSLPPPSHLLHHGAGTEGQQKTGTDHSRLSHPCHPTDRDSVCHLAWKLSNILPETLPPPSPASLRGLSRHHIPRTQF